jgi:hypothetical protein
MILVPCLYEHKPRENYSSSDDANRTGIGPPNISSLSVSNTHIVCQAEDHNLRIGFPKVRLRREDCHTKSFYKLIKDLGIPLKGTFRITERI